MFNINENQRWKMSNPLPMPPHLGQIEPPKDYFFDGKIPRLRELLPKFQGQPGMVYAQVCVQNQRRAQDEGWNEVANTAIYTIKGPEGEAHCKLYVKGTIIPGQSHDSGRRVCLVDDDVELITGLEIQPAQKVEVNAVGEVESTQEPSEVEVEKTGGSAAVEGKPTDREATEQTEA